MRMRNKMEKKQERNRKKIHWRKNKRENKIKMLLNWNKCHSSKDIESQGVREATYISHL